MPEAGWRSLRKVAGPRRAALASGEEVFAHDPCHDGDNVDRRIDVLPSRHAAKAVVHSVPDEVGSIVLGLQPGCLSRIGFRAMAVAALFFPDLLAPCDHLGIVE